MAMANAIVSTCTCRMNIRPLHECVVALLSYDLLRFPKHLPLSPHLVKCVRDKSAYFAERLYKSMKVRTNDMLLLFLSLHHEMICMYLCTIFFRYFFSPSFPFSNFLFFFSSLPSSPPVRVSVLMTTHLLG